MAKSQKKGLQFILFLALAAGILFLVFGEENNANYISYIEFNEAVQNEEIESVTIETDRVEFQKYNDEQLYYTNKWESVRQRESFWKALREIKKAQKYKPCIIFIDEFDGIGERRNYAGSGIDKENNRIITAMLNEMDGFEGGNGVMVIAATNSYKSLDAALIRPGRFDLKYTVGNPDKNTRIQLIEMYTVGKRLKDDIKIEQLADFFNGMSCSAIETVLNEASVAAMMQEKEWIDMECIQEAKKKMNQ